MGGGVGNFVAAKASKINKIQHAASCNILILKYFI
jgi:hypothetical protein